jgi:hypothetical protein
MPRDPPCRLGLLSADEADTLAGGFDDVYALLLRHQVRAIRGGVMPTTYLDPRDLDTLTAMCVGTALRTGARSAVSITAFGRNGSRANRSTALAQMVRSSGVRVQLGAAARAPYDEFWHGTAAPLPRRAARPVDLPGLPAHSVDQRAHEQRASGAGRGPAATGRR